MDKMSYLVALQVHPKELNNGIINAAFLLLFKDLVKLFASYNDGIINMLGQLEWRLQSRQRQKNLNSREVPE